MEGHFLWLTIGIVLIAAELAMGTFYLLILGLAALVAAAVAFLGASLWIQASVAAACAVAGVLWVRRYRRSSTQAPMPSLDLGQPVSFDSWSSQSDRLARVKYRDAHWDARIVGECMGQPGEILHITGMQGSMLLVSKAPPAAS
jgi:membrane protein implicated in regulation of membrane protease activity